MASVQNVNVPADCRAGAAATVVATVALTYSYDVAIWVGLLGSIAVVGPAWFTHRLLTKAHTGHLRLDEVDSGRYHLVTALAALLCALIAVVGSATLYGPRETLVAGVMSFFSALTAQLAVLPMLVVKGVEALIDNE